MINAIAALLVLAVLGLPLAWAVSRERSPFLLAGSSLLLGAGLVYAVLLLTSLAGVAWSPLSFWVPAIALASIVALRSRKTVVETRSASHWYSLWALPIDLLLVTLLVGYAVFATLGPSIENDYIAIWGLKGAVFWKARAIDWAFLERPSSFFIHADYPVLLPLMYDYMAMFRGVWDDAWLGLVQVAFSVAVLLVVRHYFVEEGGPVLGAAATLAAASAALSPWIGIGEGPVIAFTTAGLLSIRRGMDQPSSRGMMMGAILLGLGGCVKNEGLSMIVAAAFAVGLAARSWRPVLRMWPAFAIVSPWLVLRWIHVLPTDLAHGPILQRVIARIIDPTPIVRGILANPPGKALFWGCCLLALAAGWREAIRRERFLGCAIALQLGFFVGAFFVSPREIVWHFRWAWERVLSQLALPLACLALLIVIQVIRQPPATQEPQS